MRGRERDIQGEKMDTRYKREKEERLTGGEEGRSRSKGAKEREREGDRKKILGSV